MRHDIKAPRRPTLEEQGIAFNEIQREVITYAAYDAARKVKPTESELRDAAVIAMLGSKKFLEHFTPIMERIVLEKYADRMIRDRAQAIADDLFPKLATQHGIDDKVAKGVSKALERYSKRLESVGNRLEAHINRWALFSMMGGRIHDPLFCAKLMDVIGRTDDWWRQTEQRDRTLTDWVRYIDALDVPDWSNMAA